MLTELNLYKFDVSLVDKCRSDFQRQIHACGNGIVGLQHFVCLHLMWLILLLFLLLLFLLFSVLLLFYGLTPEIKMDGLIDWLLGEHKEHR